MTSPGLIAARQSAAAQFAAAVSKQGVHSSAGCTISTRPPQGRQRTGSLGPKNHDARQTHPGCQVADAGIVADVNGGGPKQRQQREAVSRQMKGGAAALKLRHEVVFNWTDHKLRFQLAGVDLRRQFEKAWKRPAFTGAAGAGVDEHGLRRFPFPRERLPSRAAGWLLESDHGIPEASHILGCSGGCARRYAHAGQEAVVAERWQTRAPAMCVKDEARASEPEKTRLCE